MHGCFLGEADGLGCESPGLGNFPWGYLGDDGSGDTNISTLDTATLGLPGGILDPSSPPVTVDELANYVNTGQADSSIIGQLATLVQSAGPAIQGIMQQIQFGQLAANTPISQLPTLRSAVLGQTSPGTFSNLLTSGGISTTGLLVGGAVLLFFLTKKRGK